MGKIKLNHVRKYDDGNAGPDLFTLGSATVSDESGRLMGDLALLTRPYADIESAVDFDEIERLANEALARPRFHHADQVIEQSQLRLGQVADLSLAVQRGDYTPIVSQLGWN